MDWMIWIGTLPARYFSAMVKMERNLIERTQEGPNPASEVEEMIRKCIMQRNTIHAPFASILLTPYSSSFPRTHHQNPILLTPTFIHAPGLGPNFERVRFLGERAVCCRLLRWQAGQRLGGGRRGRRLCGWSLGGVERRVWGNTAVATLAVFSLQRLLWAFRWEYAFGDEVGTSWLRIRKQKKMKNKNSSKSNLLHKPRSSGTQVPAVIVTQFWLKYTPPPKKIHLTFLFCLNVFQQIRSQIYFMYVQS